MYRPTLLTVSLTSIAHNLRVVKDTLAPSVKMMAVVKADGYGHGLLPVARAAVAAGADALGVSIPEEGVALREDGLTLPILVLGGILPVGARAAVEYGLTQTVFTAEAVHWLEGEARAQGRDVEVHIKLDTGMGRIGARGPEEIGEVLRAIDASPHVHLTGAFTHLSVADEAGVLSREYTRRQLDRFDEWVKLLPPGLCLHAANSAATLADTDAQYDMVRVGLLLYGCNPLRDARCKVGLWPTVKWETQIVHIKDVPSGTSLSYGRTHITPRACTIATLPVGYGDGYRRGIGNRGFVLIGGRRAPVVGAVCMDQLMVDVTGLDAHVGDPAILIGRQGAESITPEDMAGWVRTISYEILCGILPRVPRVYEGEV